MFILKAGFWALLFVATPVVAAPCGGGPYMVFFDSGSADLSPQAKAILDYAANDYKGCGAARVVVAGFTDTVGQKAANHDLSGRMALNVGEYLVQHGIPKSRFRVYAMGENGPLISTEDEVDEPRNRRVAIAFVKGDAVK